MSNNMMVALEVCHQRHVENKTFAEISAMLGIPEILAQLYWKDVAYKYLDINSPRNRETPL